MIAIGGQLNIRFVLLIEINNIIYYIYIIIIIYFLIFYQVKILVEYKSKEKYRLFTSINNIKVWLPIAVNELNIFRDNW